MCGSGLPLIPKFLRPPHFPFTGQPSVNCHFDLESSELEYFQKLITNETNNYSLQNNYKGILVTTNDTRVFLAIFIIEYFKETRSSTLLIQESITVNTTFSSNGFLEI